MFDNKRNPLVSIIIPAYNRREALSTSLLSVAKQTHLNIEILIVDDGSTEDIQSLVNNFRSNVSFPVHYYYQQNTGPGIARQNGLSHAKGEFIQYLDSDDELLPTKIERQVQTMLAYPDAIMCYTPTLIPRGDGSFGMRKFSDQPADDLLATSLQYRRWGTASCLWRYPDKQKALNYWTNLYNGEDVVHDVSAGIDTRAIVFLNEPLNIVNHSSINLSSFPTDPQKQEKYKEDILQGPVICFRLLLNCGLQFEPKYAEPLSERFFHTGYKLGKIGDLERSQIAFKHARVLSNNRLKKIEIRIARLALQITKGRNKSLLRALFNVHRWILPPEVHCYRNI